jgi:hypothetical protein
MNLPLEIKVIQRFVVKDKQTRYIQFISSNKNRKKFINELPHFRDFKWPLFEEVNGPDADIIRRLQTFKGNTTSCYAISENTEIDQKVLTISTALMEIGRDLSTILVFGDADFIYYEGEPPKNRYISKTNFLV